MKIRCSSDTYEDAGLKPLLHSLNIGSPFIENDYGNNEVEIFFVINCLKFAAKHRTRFDSKEKVLYGDIILDYKKIKTANIAGKKSILAIQIINFFDILDKYKNLNIDKIRLKEDASKYFSQLGWI